MNMLKTGPLFSLLVVLMFVGGCQTVSETLQSITDPGDVGGDWQGTVTQRGYGDYPVEMTITRLQRGGPSGTTNYPSLNCGGELTYEGREDSMHIFTERKTEGRGSCAAQGRIEVRATSSNRLDWNWYRPGAQGTPLVKGTLDR